MVLVIVVLILVVSIFCVHFKTDLAAMALSLTCYFILSYQKIRVINFLFVPLMQSQHKCMCDSILFAIFSVTVGSRCNGFQDVLNSSIVSSVASIIKSMCAGLLCKGPTDLSQDSVVI